MKCLYVFFRVFDRDRVLLTVFGVFERRRNKKSFEEISTLRSVPAVRSVFDGGVDVDRMNDDNKYFYSVFIVCRYCVYDHSKRTMFRVCVRRRCEMWINANDRNWFCVVYLNESMNEWISNEISLYLLYILYIHGPYATQCRCGPNNRCFVYIIYYQFS